ncbi:hypothetical protein [Nostoc phage A1]|nr:hypothetical protein [Nostoc phage A1]
MINKERRLKVVYKTDKNGLIIVSPVVSSIDPEALEIAIKVLDGKINIDSLINNGVDVIDDGESYIEAPDRFWKACKEVKPIIKTTEDTFFHKNGVSIYERNMIIVKRKNEKTKS